MAITIVIVLTTIPERQIFTFPIVLAIVLPPQCLWFNSMPLRFLCELKKFASVSSHVSSHMAILLRNFCIILLFAFMAWFEIINEIERRLYQEALSPDLKWRKQGLASLGRCCLIENAISPPNCEVFKPASKSVYPNIWCVDIFKKIWESSSSFLSWLRFMKVGKVEKNFHTFLLSSSLVHHLIGPSKRDFEGFWPWATSKNRLKHLIPILSRLLLIFCTLFLYEKFGFGNSTKRFIIQNDSTIFAS